MKCTLRGDPGATGPSAVTLTDAWGFGGLKADCKYGVERPAMPEDAESLSYKEVCRMDQYQEETRYNNTWSKDHCDSMA